MSCEKEPVVKLNCGTIDFCTEEEQEEQYQCFKIKLNGKGRIKQKEIPSVPTQEQVFEESGTFTAPKEGYYRVTCVGGAGGGGGAANYNAPYVMGSAGGAGAAGYLNSRTVHLEKDQVVTVVVGVGGAGGTRSVGVGTANSGQSGLPTSFSDYINASGGSGGGGVISSVGVAPGLGSEDGFVWGGNGDYVFATGDGNHANVKAGKCVSGHSFSNRVYSRGGKGGDVAVSASSGQDSKDGMSGGAGVCIVRW